MKMNTTSKKVLAILLTAALLVVCNGALAGKGQQKQHTLRVVSYNIRHGKGMDGQINLKRIAHVIAKENPDIVALQEVDKNCKRSGNRDIAKELGEILSMEHRFGKFMNYQEGEYGMAVLSRLPITETIRHPLSGKCCALEVKVQAEGLSLPVSFICIHNNWKNERLRVTQIQTLMGSLQNNNNNPIILAGDFNGERTDASMKLLKNAQWKILNKNGKKTYPADEPKVEIDHFAVRGFPEISVKHDVIDEQIASDHRPIYAAIAFQSEENAPDKK